MATKKAAPFGGKQAKPFGQKDDKDDKDVKKPTKSTAKKKR